MLTLCCVYNFTEIYYAIKTLYIYEFNVVFNWCSHRDLGWTESIPNQRHRWIAGNSVYRLSLLVKRTCAMRGTASQQANLVAEPPYLRL